MQCMWITLYHDLKAHQIYMKLAVRHCLSAMRMSLRVVVVGVGLHFLYLVKKRMNWRKLRSESLYQTLVVYQSTMILGCCYYHLMLPSGEFMMSMLLPHRKYRLHRKYKFVSLGTENFVAYGLKLLALNLVYLNENSRIGMLKKQLQQPRREQDYAVTVNNLDIPKPKKELLHAHFYYNRNCVDSICNLHVISCTFFDFWPVISFHTL